MKICIVTTSYPSYPGDPRGKMAHDTARYLVRTGVAVDVVTPADPDAPAGASVLDGVSVHRYSYPFSGSRRFDLRRPGQGGIPYALKRSWWAKLALPFFVLALLRAALPHVKRADIIHAQWLPTALMVLLAKPFHRRPIVVTVRGSDMPWATGNNVLKFVISRLINRVDHFIAVSERYAEVLHAELGVSQSKINYIQNGIDPSEFAPAESKHKVRQELGFPLEKLCMLYVGNMIAEKGVYLLFDAWSATQGNGHDPYLVFIGDGNAVQVLSARAAEHDRAGQVWLLGKQNNKTVADWMRAADILVFPTMHPEGVSQVVKEAMASGLPIITTPAGGIPEVICDGVTGYLVPQGDTVALTRRLISLVEDPGRRDAMGGEARRWIVNSDLSIEHAATKVRAVYDRVLSSTKGRHEKA